jgi:hypothetical protein
VERHASDEAIVFLDDAHFPVVIATWVGEASLLTAEAYIAWFKAQIARAEEEEVWLIAISDSRLAGRPDATVRRYFADEIGSTEGRRLMSKQTSLVVHDSQLLRGALTAISWLVPGVDKLPTARTMHASFEQVRRLLRDKAQTFPGTLEPDNYVNPAEQDELAKRIFGTA